MDDNKQILDKILENKDERLGSMRTETKEALEAAGDPMAEAFKEQTPFQKFVGRIIGGLVMANGKADIERMWEWGETQLKLDGAEVPVIDFSARSMILLQAAYSIGISAPNCYRCQRKMLLTATADLKRELTYNPPNPEWSDEVKSKYDIQCETQLLLAKAKNNEDVENAWVFAESKLGMGILPEAKLTAMFNVYSECTFTKKKYEAIRDIFVKLLTN